MEAENRIVTRSSLQLHNSPVAKWQIRAPSSRVDGLQEAFQPFNRIPNQLLLRILSVVGEENPDDYWPSESPAPGPLVAAAALTCKRWFDVVTDKSAQHLWHFSLDFDYNSEKDMAKELTKFRARLTESRGFDLYVDIDIGDQHDSQLIHFGTLAIRSLAQYAPKLADLRLVPYSMLLPFLAQLPECPRLHQLRIDEQINITAGSPGLDGLIELYASGSNPGSDLASIFPALTQILTVRINKLTRIPIGPRLSRLQLWYRSKPKLSWEDLIELLISIPQLRSLDLYDQLDNESHMDGVVIPRGTSSLRSLVIEDELAPIMCFLGSFHFPQLTHLSVSIDGESTGPIVNLPSLKNLTFLKPHESEAFLMCIPRQSVDAMVFEEVRSWYSLPSVDAPRLLRIEVMLAKGTDAISFLKRYPFPALHYTEELILKVETFNFFAKENAHPRSQWDAALTSLSVFVTADPRPFGVLAAALPRLDAPNIARVQLNTESSNSHSVLRFSRKLPKWSTPAHIFWDISSMTGSFDLQQVPQCQIELEIILKPKGFPPNMANSIALLITELSPYQDGKGSWTLLFPYISSLTARIPRLVAAEVIEEIQETLDVIRAARQKCGAPIGQVAIIDCWGVARLPSPCSDDVETV